jgi:chromosome segregation ATPase
VFYLIQHIWFFLLLAAAFGAFLMWLVQAWSKEEKANGLLGDWEAQLEALRNENSRIKAQLEAASGNASSLSALQADLNRQQQQNSELGSQREAAEKSWTKKYRDMESDFREKTTALEKELAKLRGEFGALAHERDSVSARVDESSRTSAARALELDDARKQIQQWVARMTELEAQGHEARIRLKAVTSECDRLREAAKAGQANEREESGLRQDLAAAQQELASLRADIATAHEAQNQWREKWHEAEARYGRAQTELAALEARQSEAAAFTGRFAEVEAESNQARTRLAELTGENERLREELKRAGARSDANQDEELRKRLATLEQESANLKSHLSTASYLQDEWRNKWHDVEEKYAAAQEQIAETAARLNALSGLESENNKLQSELASRASQYTLLRAEADLHVSKIRELSDRLAALEPGSHARYDQADNGLRVK